MVVGEGIKHPRGTAPRREIDEAALGRPELKEIRHYDGAGAKQDTHRTAKLVPFIEPQGSGEIDTEALEVLLKCFVEIGLVCWRQENEVIRNGGQEGEFPCDFSDTDPGWIERVLVADR